MLIKHLPKKMLLLFLGDAILIYLAYIISPSVRFSTIRMEFAQPSWAGALILGIYILTFYLSDLYDFDAKFKSPKYLLRFFAAIFISALATMILFFLFPDLMAGRGVFFKSAALVGILTYSWRLLFEWWFKNVLGKQKRLLIIGAGWAGKTLYDSIKGNTDYNVIGFVDDDPCKWGSANSPEVVGGCKTVKEQVRANEIDSIVIAITHLKGPELLKCALDCKMDGVQVYDMPSFYEEITGKVPVEHVDDFWFVSTPIAGVKKNAYNLKIKRTLDITLSFIGLVVSFPLTILTAIAIKVESPGPIFYKQRRIGLNGKTFTLLKFRSMRVGTEGDRRFAGQKNDPRITRIGKIIRLSRIDEIPQVWNVLKGEMGFIGPRALMEAEVREFETKVPYFSLRHSVRPGITGWAQINYHHGASVEDALEKLQYDLFYIKNLSPLLDFLILLKTVKVVLFGRGAR